MKVYRIRPDRERYQMIGGVPGFVDRHPPTHAESPSLQEWHPWTLPIERASKRRGDFLFFPLEFIVCSTALTETLRDCLKGDVQILPVNLEGSEDAFCLWNISNFVEALDVQKSHFPPALSQAPARWVFQRDAFSRPMLFRDVANPAIPLVATGFADESRDFYLRVVKRKLRGLKFEQVWESG